MSESNWIASLEQWPWEHILKPNYLGQWLKDPDHRFSSRVNDNEMPAQLAALRVGLGQYSGLWLEAIQQGVSVRDGLVQETELLLRESGFRDEIIHAFLIALIAAKVVSGNSGVFINHGPLKDVALAAAEAAMGGCIGRPMEMDIELLLGFAEKCGSSEAGKLLSSVRSAISGDIEARRVVIYTAIPYWRKVVKEWSLERWNKYSEALGFPFSFTRRLKNDPEIIAFSAAILYETGHAGEDREAISMAIDAALKGSFSGWMLLRSWSELGDGDRVLGLLLSKGSLYLSGRDCLSSEAFDGGAA